MSLSLCDIGWGTQAPFWRKMAHFSFCSSVDCDGWWSPWILDWAPGPRSHTWCLMGYLSEISSHLSWNTSQLQLFSHLWPSLVTLIAQLPVSVSESPNFYRPYSGFAFEVIWTNFCVFHFVPGCWWAIGLVGGYLFATTIANFKSVNLSDFYVLRQKTSSQKFIYFLQLSFYFQMHNGVLGFWGFGVLANMY